MGSRIKQVNLEGHKYNPHERLPSNQKGFLAEVLVRTWTLLCTDRLIHPGTMVEAAKRLQTMLNIPSRQLLSPYK